MVRPTFAQIDLDILKTNYQSVLRLVSQPVSKSDLRTSVIAVVKANAYGHGAVAVARALEEAGASMLACADIEEGVQLREAGINVPILVFGALNVSDLNGIVEHGLTPTVSSPSAARALQVMAEKKRSLINCHLKIDTGMNRFGLRYDNLRKTLPEVVVNKNLIFDSIYTHFATADDFNLPLFEKQQKRFLNAQKVLSEFSLSRLFCHAANSAALLRDRRCWLNAVRPGLLLYGIVPPSLKVPTDFKVRPVMTLHSKIVTVKGVRAGETVGYGGKFSASKPTRIAVVPAGYADGLDVRLSGTGYVLVRGRRVSIVGSICMDSIMIDVTDVHVETGDDVVLIGEQGDDCIDVIQMSKWLGTVPHEILCRTGSRIGRLYKDSGTNSEQS